MASGDIIFTAVSYPASGDWKEVNGPVHVTFPLTNEVSQNISNGSATFSMTVGPKPYGQDWDDPRSPITPGKQYRVIIEEV